MYIIMAERLSIDSLSSPISDPQMGLIKSFPAGPTEVNRQGHQSSSTASYRFGVKASMEFRIVRGQV